MTHQNDIYAVDDHFMMQSILRDMRRLELLTKGTIKFVRLESEEYYTYPISLVKINNGYERVWLEPDEQTYWCEESDDRGTILQLARRING
jgi:hypothetical protein